MTLLARTRPPPLRALFSALKSSRNTNTITRYEITRPDAILALADPSSGHIPHAKEAASGWETASLGSALQRATRHLAGWHLGHEYGARFGRPIRCIEDRHLGSDEGHGRPDEVEESQDEYIGAESKPQEWEDGCDGEISSGSDHETSGLEGGIAGRNGLLWGLP